MPSSSKHGPGMGSGSDLWQWLRGARRFEGWALRSKEAVLQMPQEKVEVKALGGLHLAVPKVGKVLGILWSWTLLGMSRKPMLPGPLGLLNQPYKLK